MRADFCFFFRGVQHKTCDAKIEMDATRNELKRLACVSGGDHARCPSFRFPTAQELADFDAMIDKHLAELREREKRGECSDCGVKITAVRQDGRCVYAEPCGHRIGQGDAAAVRRALGLPKV